MLEEKDLQAIAQMMREEVAGYKTETEQEESAHE